MKVLGDWGSTAATTTNSVFLPCTCDVEHVAKIIGIRRANIEVLAAV
jgi:hypothetical protein